MRSSKLAWLACGARCSISRLRSFLPFYPAAPLPVPAPLRALSGACRGVRSLSSPLAHLYPAGCLQRALLAEPARKGCDHSHRRAARKGREYASWGSRRPLDRDQESIAAMSSDGRRRSVDLPPPPPGGASRPPPAPHHPPSGEKGWRYTLRVPSWSQAQLPDGETAVFYQAGGRQAEGPQAGVPTRASLQPALTCWCSLLACF